MLSFSLLSSVASPVASTLPDLAPRSAPLPSEKTSAPTVPASAVQPLGRSEAGQEVAEELREALNKVSKAVSGYRSELQFSIDDELGVSVVKVIDTQTKDVIRQIPSEEMLNIAKNLDKVVGMLFEQKV